MLHMPARRILAVKSEVSGVGEHGSYNWTQLVE